MVMVNQKNSKMKINKRIHSTEKIYDAMKNYDYRWDGPNLKYYNSNDIINLGEDDETTSIENTQDKIYKPFINRGYSSETKL